MDHKPSPTQCFTHPPGRASAWAQACEALGSRSWWMHKERHPKWDLVTQCPRGMLVSRPRHWSQWALPVAGLIVFCKPVGGQGRGWLARVVAKGESPAATTLALPSPSPHSSETEIQVQGQQDKAIAATIEGRCRKGHAS